MLKFGPYLVDLAAGEVRKNGSRIRLQDKPLRVLAMLVERQGQLVTREELQKHLWPEDTFVDFETGLNTAVSKLRDALSDNAENPRYIETIPRRGYRFLMAVEFADLNPRTRNGVITVAAEKNTLLDPSLAEKESPGPPQPAVESPAMSAASALPHAFVREAPGKKSALRATIWIPVAAAVVLASLAGGYFYFRRAPRLTDKDTIVLADFTNTTGDAIFDDTLKTALNVSLRQSPFLDLLPERRVGETLQEMTRPPDTKLAPEVARELCQRAGARAYIAGSIGSLGSEYVLGLKAVNCQSGDTLVQEQVTAKTKERVLDALSEAASQLRGGLGETLASVQKFDVPLRQATTPSLEALKAWSVGLAKNRSPEALTSFQRAVELDPNFTMAYRSLGGYYLDLSENTRAADYLTKAFQLREHTYESERLLVTADYYSFVTGELDKAAKAFQEDIEIYPRATGAYEDYAGVLASLGQYEKAVQVTKKTMHLEPEVEEWYENLGILDVNLQRFAEAQGALREAQKRGNTLGLHIILYALAFITSDSAAMAEQEKSFAAIPEYEAYGLAMASDTQAYSGHLAQASELARRAVESAVHADNKENGGVFLTNAALRQAAYGNSAEARQSAEAALRLAPASQGTEVEAALALAMAGNTARAESVAQDLGKLFPLDTQMQLLWLPAIRAQLALNKKNPTYALNILQAASPIELGNVPFGTTTGLYHLYVRGQAYLAAGQGAAAAAEFQKLIDHSGILLNCWTGALAHLGVARANALQARTSEGPDADAARLRALAAYKDFLTLWKDADPDIPILKQAKSEYAKLP
jgi:DNA-binding winged helix-turn-helix (wHTH) protein/Tfp pilus assembly protein PilF